MNPYAIWIPSDTGRHLMTFASKDDACRFVIKFGGGLEIIANTFENF
jgi:hypothetical protein